MSADPFLELHDGIETEPAALQQLFIDVLTSSLSKRIAADKGLPWTQAHETAHQEKIAALVAAARQLRVATIRMIAVRPDGQRVARDISVDMISKDRVLQ
jgi:hypothetical protein